MEQKSLPIQPLPEINVNDFLDIVLDTNVPALLQAGYTEHDAYMLRAAEQVSNLIGHNRLRIQEPQYLSALHDELRRCCSALYKHIHDQKPTLNRSEINAQPDLLRLNAVRKGIRLAMNASYASARRDHLR